MIEAARQPVYVFEGFRLDAQRRVLLGADGRSITLTPRLFDTLLYFVERAGQLLTKEQLLEELWPNVVVEEHNLNKTVSELRRVLGEKPGEHRFIVTKPGRGYRFVAGVSIAPDTASEQAVRSGGIERARRSGVTRYWIGAAAGVVGLAAALGALGFLGSPPELQLPVTPLSLEKGGQGFPVWSPDGKSIAYAAAERAGEPARIFVRDLDSPISRPITGARNSLGVRQWTTAGRIFFREGPSLYSVSPVGASPETVAGLDLSDVPALAVTRDGTTLALVRRDADGAFGIWTTPLPTIDLERYDIAPLTLESLVSASLEFSPDGRKLLLRWQAPPEQFWLLPFPADPNRRPRRVLESLPPVLGNGFSWLPDNVSLVVGTSDPARTIAPQLSIADTRSGAFRSFTNGSSGKAGPAVSPDGERLAYLEANADYDIVTLSLDSAEVAPLIATANREEQPAWAADVPTMAYITTRRGHYELWLRRAGQGDTPLVTPDDFPTRQWLFAPAPSPDGARVIFQTVDWASGASYLWLRSVAGGAPERLTNGAGERAGSWSPDGAWYVYSTRESDGTDTLRKVRTTGRAAPETLLAGIAQGNLLPSWSADGEWLLVSNRGLKLVSHDGKTIRELNIESAPCGFARNASLIYCVRGPQQGRRSFVALDFDGNVVREIGSVPSDRWPASSAGQLAPALALSVLPDGSGVTYSVANPSSSLWLMEGLSQIALP